MEFDKEKECLDRRALTEVSRFFTDKFINHWKKNEVTVLVEDFSTSLYYLPCDQYGFPTYREFKSIIFDPLSLTAICDDFSFPVETVNIEEIVVIAERPMLVYQHMTCGGGHNPKQYVYLWSGRIMSRSKVPLEKLDVKYLMKLAQEAIKKREGLIINEVIENRLYI